MEALKKWFKDNNFDVSAQALASFENIENVNEFEEMLAQAIADYGILMNYSDNEDVFDEIMENHFPQLARPMCLTVDEVEIDTSQKDPDSAELVLSFGEDEDEDEDGEDESYTFLCIDSTSETLQALKNNHIGEFVVILQSEECPLIVPLSRKSFAQLSKIASQYSNDMDW